MVKLSLAWEAHAQNISKGLTYLQQNGEFVDMTLAADGHHVKVHQMVISLASPYLKEIITSLDNPHPVIFLTKVSHPVLSAILEYIYTGEVVIEKNHITDLLEAAKELKILGLNEMTFELSTQELTAKAVCETSHKSNLHISTEGQDCVGNETQNSFKEETNFFVVKETEDCFDNDEDLNTETIINKCNTENRSSSADFTQKKKDKKDPKFHMQYTISNMGSIQMILNRYMYRLRYTSVRRSKHHGHRHWRCVDYDNAKKKCPATVVTNDDIVIKRFAAHNHPFHDQKILKKVRDGAVFTQIHHAEAKCKIKPPGKT